KLKGYQPLSFPLDFSRIANRSYAGGHKAITLEPKLVDELSEVSQSNRATLFLTLLTAGSIILSRYSGQPDIVVGSTIANRHNAETESMIGFFVNSIPVRTQLDDSDTFISLLGKVREQTFQAFSYQDTPFEKIVERVVKQRDVTQHPIFNVMFV